MPAKPSEPVTTSRVDADGCLVLERRFPPGVIVRPSSAGATMREARPRTACPACGCERVTRYASSPRADYYRCGRCVDPDTAEYSTFRVFRRSRERA